MKDIHLPLQYRGISLLSCTYKLYSTLLNRRLYSYFDVMEHFSDAQNGFRRGRSCEDHIFSLISQIKNGIGMGHDVFCCYIDFQKAFDYLDRDLLLLKLLRAGIDGKFYWAMKNSMLDTSSCVRINHNLSGFFKTTFGTRQGDPISPTNFSVFVNDLLCDLQDNKKHSDFIIGNVFAYADDIVIVSDSEEDLQKLIDIVHKWCNEWRLNINIDKTKVVHYRKEKKPRTNFVFKWADNSIGIVDGYKYLGLFIDQHLDFDRHCEMITNSAGRALGKILSKFAYFRNIAFTTFEKLFQSNVESIMSYGVSCIGLEKFDFEKIQARAIRYFLGVHPKTPIPALFGEMGWIPFKFKRWACMCRTWNRYIDMDDSRLNKQIFLFDYSSNADTWCTDFHDVCNKLDLSDSFLNLRSIDFNVFYEKLESYAYDNWALSVESKPKLRTYKLFKSEPTAEYYVKSFMRRFQRSTFAKFRCGILPIQIELGRFRGQKVVDRICPLCKNAVETEIHFLLECSFYNRNAFFQELSIDENLNSTEILKICMSEHQKSTSKFICELWKQRQKFLFDM